MKRTKILLFTSIFMLAIGSIGAAYAAIQIRVEVENHISLGDINVSLAEYKINENGMESVYTDPDIVMPGDVISKIPRFTCIAEPCYIRARLSFDKDKDVEGLTERDISGISDEWIKIGDYYYYKYIMNTDQSTDFFKSVSIPAEWTNVHELQNLGITVQVDAIQAKNFIPDYDSEEPWGNEEIEVCVHKGNKENIVNPYSSMYVEFEGNTHKLVAVPEDFFSNLGTAMPGDILSDTVVLKNTTDHDAELFFYTDLPDDISEEQKKLLKKIQLTISLDGQMIYNGDLEAASLFEEISLGIYKSQDEKRFDFTLKIPEELKNRYALTDTVVRWVFRVHQDEADNTGGISTSKPVKTGDTVPILHYLIMAGIGVFFAAGIIIYRKKQRREEDFI